MLIKNIHKLIKRNLEEDDVLSDRKERLIQSEFFLERSDLSQEQQGLCHLGLLHNLMYFQ